MLEEKYNNMIQEKKDTTAIKYILQSEELFYDIGFRVMKNLQNDVLLPCYKAKHNGKNEFIYFTDHLVSIEDKIRSMETEKTVTMLSSLFQAICKVEENGFINVSCVDNRLDRIYVEEGTNKIKLIYLPIVYSTIQNDKSTFENEVRTRLIKILGEMTGDENARIHNLIYILMDGTLKMEELAKKIREDSRGVKKTVEADNNSQLVRNEDRQNRKGRTLELISVDGNVKFRINKNEFIIGKSIEMAEGVIQGNPAVSRKHCNVILRNQEYYIQDLGSVNGTFVDGIRISCQEVMQIRQGSSIMIADMQFRANYI